MLFRSPEIEKIAGQDQVVAGPGYLVQEGMERGANGGRHLTQVRVRDDDHSRCGGRGRHGPSLGTWNGARKHITVHQ